jgi:NTP pyrophosphatase (non-canonical NTP hydrolase)
MNDAKNNIEDLKKLVSKFVNDRKWEHNPKNLAMSISIEAAELMEIFQWLSTEEAWNIDKNSKMFTHLKEELADVMIYCLSLANQLGIDVSKAIDDKLEKNAIKYPIER